MSHSNRALEQSVIFDVISGNISNMLYHTRAGMSHIRASHDESSIDESSILALM